MTDYLRLHGLKELAEKTLLTDINVSWLTIAQATRQAVGKMILALPFVS